MKGYISNEVEDIAYKCYVGDYFTKQYQFPTILVAPELLIYNTTWIITTGTVTTGVIIDSVTTGEISTGIPQ